MVSLPAIHACRRSCRLITGKLCLHLDITRMYIYYSDFITQMKMCVKCKSGALFCIFVKSRIHLLVLQHFKYCAFMSVIILSSSGLVLISLGRYYNTVVFVTVVAAVIIIIISILSTDCNACYANMAFVYLSKVGKFALSSVLPYYVRISCYCCPEAGVG